jgi:micrococcal nuclease
VLFGLAAVGSIGLLAISNFGDHSSRLPVVTPDLGALPVVAPNAVVTRVVDGDTIEVDVRGNRSMVRLIGIDTPEKTGGLLAAECYGDEATVITSHLLVPGEEVFLEGDVELRDRYGRLLAYVHRSRDGLFINHHLVEIGAAAAKTYEPNSHHAALFGRAQARAKEANRGLWQTCDGPDRPLA